LPIFGYPDLSGLRRLQTLFMLTPRSSSRPPAYDKHISKTTKTTVAIRHFVDISSAGPPAKAASA